MIYSFHVYHTLCFFTSEHLDHLEEASTQGDPCSSIFLVLLSLKNSSCEHDLTQNPDVFVLENARYKRKYFHKISPSSERLPWLDEVESARDGENYPKN